MDALIYFLIWGAAIFLMLRFGCGAHVMGHGRQGGEARAEGRAEPGELRWVPPEADVDPVCGKTVHPDRAKPSVHDGRVYYFCSRECRELFKAAPQLYVGPQAAQQHRQLEHHDG